MTSTGPTIPYDDLQAVNATFAEELRAAFDATLARGWFILGSALEAFEAEWASYLSARHAVGVGSGLDALTIALRALDLPPDAEVLVPSNTFIATILAILECRLQPVLVEPDAATYNIDPARLEASLTPRTRALLVVHLYGKPCDMTRIQAFAARHSLRLVEDCAQAHGATHRGRKVGTFGDFGAFSFYPTKNLGALGDGGALVTGDADLAAKARLLRNYGSRQKYHNEIVGQNSRLDELQAAFLSVKLRRLDEVNAHKRRLADLYRAGLSPAFVRPVVEPDNVDVFHIYNVRHSRRDELREFLKARGIMTEIHYPVPPHAQTALRGRFAAADFPLAAEIHRTTLSLPISFCHTPSDVERVIAAANTFAASV